MVNLPMVASSKLAAPTLPRRLIKIGTPKARYITPPDQTTDATRWTKSVAIARVLNSTGEAAL